MILRVSELTKDHHRFSVQLDRFGNLYTASLRETSPYKRRRTQNRVLWASAPTDNPLLAHEEYMRVIMRHKNRGFVWQENITQE